MFQLLGRVQWWLCSSLLTLAPSLNPEHLVLQTSAALPEVEKLCDNCAHKLITSGPSPPSLHRHISTETTHIQSAFTFVSLGVQTILHQLEITFKKKVTTVELCLQHNIAAGNNLLLQQLSTRFKTSHITLIEHVEVQRVNAEASCGSSDLIWFLCSSDDSVLNTFGLWTKQFVTLSPFSLRRHTNNQLIR